MKIALVKCGGANFGSVQYALERIGVEAVVTDKAEIIQNADKEIFKHLSEHLQGVAANLELKTKRVKCGDCEHEFDVALTMDQANFFGAKS